MKIIKFILGIVLIIGPIITIPKLLGDGQNFATLIVPIIFLIGGIWLLKSALSKSK